MFALVQDFSEPLICSSTLLLSKKWLYYVHISWIYLATDAFYFLNKSSHY